MNLIEKHQQEVTENNPKTAVWEYLKTRSEFEIDKNLQNKLMITVAPDGYLRRVK